MILAWLFRSLLQCAYGLGVRDGALAVVVVGVLLWVLNRRRDAP